MPNDYLCCSLYSISFPEFTVLLTLLSVLFLHSAGSEYSFFYITELVFYMHLFLQFLRKRNLCSHFQIVCGLFCRILHTLSNSNIRRMENASKQLAINDYSISFKQKKRNYVFLKQRYNKKKSSFSLEPGYLLNIKKLLLLKKHSSYFCIIPTLPVLTDH